jgi:thymidylate synthase (FAD)
MFTTVNLLNLLKFIELRKSEHAQYEIRVYAEALLKLIENIIPETILAFKRNNGTAKME